MYSRGSIHLVGKLSYVWDTVGTLHISPRDLLLERRQSDNIALFERRRTMVNELQEKAASGDVGRRINTLA